MSELQHTHTHPFNGPFSGTTQVSRYQEGKTNLDFTEARDCEWQWHQLGCMQVCTLLQTDNHASNPSLSFITGRMPFLPPNQQCQSTEGKSELQHARIISFLVVVGYTLCLRKKQDTKLLPITSPNVNRFSQFFYWLTHW